MDWINVKIYNLNKFCAKYVIMNELKNHLA